MTTATTPPPGDRPLSVIVVGASGDLARKKLLPALFSLFCRGCLPERLRIYGFARTPLDDDGFRALVRERLTCRYVPGESCADRMDAFLARCHYQRGDYASRDSYLDLFDLMRRLEQRPDADCVWYLATPPSLFLGVAAALAGAGLVSCDARGPQSRVVIEKPFGRDRRSSDELTAGLAGIFSEKQTFRIDHYLGKEVIRNLLVLRFANLVLQPLWHRRFVESVSIAWHEDLGTEGRGGYFDSYGIIRDCMQNHLLQMLALAAMERPRDLRPDSVRNAKVRLLRAVRPVAPGDLVVGQYGRGTLRGMPFAGYAEDPGVAPGSRTPTYAAAVLAVDNPRWRGVPFLLEAGKGLATRSTVIRVRFRPVSEPLFPAPEGAKGNVLELVVQPGEAVRLRVATKAPGLDFTVAERDLDLAYGEAFAGLLVPDAYERLLLDAVVTGDSSLFIRTDELAASWDIFTPVLHHLDQEAVVPEPYAFGSRGPASALALAERHGVRLD